MDELQNRHFFSIVLNEILSSEEGAELFYVQESDDDLEAHILN
jgi:hypothetical protein